MLFLTHQPQRIQRTQRNREEEMHMTPGTEIKITIADNGSWTASSPTYPGWSASGNDSFDCGRVAAEDLEVWVAGRTAEDLECRS